MDVEADDSYVGMVTEADGVPCVDPSWTRPSKTMKRHVKCVSFNDNDVSITNAFSPLNECGAGCGCCHSEPLMRVRSGGSWITPLMSLPTKPQAAPEKPSSCRPVGRGSPCQALEASDNRNEKTKHLKELNGDDDPNGDVTGYAQNLPEMRRFLIEKSMTPRGNARQF